MQATKQDNGKDLAVWALNYDLLQLYIVSFGLASSEL